MAERLDRPLTALLVVWAVAALLPIGEWTGITNHARYAETWALWWRMLLLTGLGTLLLLLLSQGAIAAALHAAFARVLKVPRRVFLVGLGMLASAEAIAVAIWCFARNPQIIDSWVQCFQARIFLSGAALAPPPASVPHFAAMNMLLADRGWAGQYPPVHAALLAAGVAAGAVWLVTPLMAALLPVAVYRLGVETGDERIARLAAGLVLLSPFVIAMDASAMNHLPAALCVAWGLATAVGVARGSARAGAALGAATGLLIGLRPLDGMALAVVGALALTTALSRGAWRVAMATAVTGLVTVAPTLAYNAATTGNPLTFTYLAVWGAGHGVGLDQATPWGQSVSLMTAAGHSALDAHNLDVYLLEWPVPVSVLIALGLLLRRGRLDAGLRVAAAYLLVLVAGLAFYFHRDILYGPRFLFSAVPSVLVLLAAAMVRLGTLTPSLGWRRLVVGDLAIVGLSVLALVAVTARVPGRLASYATRNTELALHPDEDARVAGIHDAVVLVPDQWRVRLIARLWAAGVPMKDSPRIFRSFDACALEERLADAATRGVRGAALLAELEAAMPQAQPGTVAVELTRDPLLRLPENRQLTARCAAELDRDRQIGVLQFEPFLCLNSPRFDGDVVWAREMGAEDPQLRARYPQRAFYRYMVSSQGVPTFTPLPLASASPAG